LYEVRNRLVHDWFEPSAIRLQASDLDREFLLVFVIAVSEKLIGDRAYSQARDALRQVLARLQLSTADLAALLGVSANIIDEWESGHVTIPPDAQATLNRASNAVTRMLLIFRPERLPHVIRQRVDMFGGESGLDWILQGRIHEVAGLYETAFAYQG
jgi:transcriptional regulator with XRE-family HTH domain